ncbi:hypothetical protein EAO72_14855 [Streptomyces sp. or43]|nr:hypothetical protein EAO72_14855 [Streptomyces sp. or43]
MAGVSALDPSGTPPDTVLSSAVNTAGGGRIPSVDVLGARERAGEPCGFTCPFERVRVISPSARR